MTTAVVGTHVTPLFLTYSVRSNLQRHSGSLYTCPVYIHNPDDFVLYCTVMRSKFAIIMGSAKKEKKHGLKPYIVRSGCLSMFDIVDGTHSE